MPSGKDTLTGALFKVSLPHLPRRFQRPEGGGGSGNRDASYFGPAHISQQRSLRYKLKEYLLLNARILEILCTLVF